MSDIGGLTLLATSTTFDNISTADVNGNHDVNYPTTNNDGPYTILGPVLLPQIYGKDLNMLEIGSSGLIALSVNDTNVLKIDQAQNTANDGQPFDTVQVEAQLSNEAIQFRSGTSANKVVLDSLMVSENATQNIISTSKSGGLQLNDVVAMTQTLSVEDNVFFSSQLSVADDVILSSNLSVEGVVTFSSHAYVEGKVFKLPTGSGTERPVYGSGFDDAPTGSIFFNTDDSKFQGLHDDGIWRNMGGVEDSDGDTKILAELVDDEDTLVFYANDATTPRMTMDENNLSINLDVQITDTLSVADEVFLNSNLSVGENLVVGATLSVAGKATFCNDTYIEGQTFKIPAGVASDRPAWDSYSPTTLSSTDLSANPLTSGAPMGAVFYNTESDKFQGLHKDGVWRNMGGVVDTDADTKILAEIDGDEDTLFFYANDATTPRMTMDENNLSVNLDVQITDTLSVADSVVFSSNLSVAGPIDFQGVLTVDDATVLKSTLSVENHTQLNNTLSVMQTAYFNSTLSVTGNVQIESALSVYSEADIINNVRLGATLSVTGATIFTSTLSVGSSSMFTGFVEMENTLSVEGNSDFKSAVQLGSILSVTDTVTFSSNLSVSSDVTFSDTLSVANAVNFASTLSVGGATTLSNILSVTGATTLSSSLSVAGVTTLGNDLSVSGDIALNPGSTLTVDNIITTDSEKDLVITLGSDSTGKLRVNGDLEILGTLNQINTIISSVQVTDKTITLAVGEDDIAGSNQTIHEDALSTNHGAGVLVEGRPNGVGVDNQYYDGSYTSADALDIDNIYEKSIKWNLSDTPNQPNVSGMKYLGGLNSFETVASTNADQISKESFWEIKGGSLRITSLFKNSANLVDKVSYGFRISRNRQLQIIKHEWTTTLNSDSGNVETSQSSRVLQTIGVSFSS